MNLAAQTRTVTSAAIILAGASLASRMAGLLRDRLFATKFGAGDVLDIYNAAFRIPDTLFTLLVLGALSAGFIPIFTRLWRYDKKEGARFANAALTYLTIALVVLAAAAALAAVPITRILAPGFSVDKQRATVELTRIMLLSPILFGVSNIVGGILQSLRRFILYAVAPIVYNAGIIIGILWLYPVFGEKGLALGVALGALLYLAIQLPGLKNTGISLRLNFSWRNTELPHLLRLTIPRILGLGTYQLNIFFITSIASTLSVGSIAIWNFGSNIQSFPIGIFALSLAIAAFPALSSAAAKKEMPDFRRLCSTGARQILFLMIPLSVIILLLRAQIVRVILGDGAFDWHATISTADTLAFFSLGLFAQALNPLLIRAFYALEDTIRPFLVGIGAWAVNITLALMLKDRLQVPGLALAFSTATVLQSVALWALLRRRVGTLHESEIVPSLLKISAATIPMALAIQGIKYPLANLVDMTRFWGILTQGAVAGIVGLVVFVAFAHLFRTPELEWTISAIRRRIPKALAQEIIHPNDGQ